VSYAITEEEVRMGKVNTEDILRSLAKQKAAVIRSEINRLKRHLRNYEEFCRCGHERGLHNLKAHTCSDMGAGIGIDCPCRKYVPVER
jgi:hypothetical protein